MAKTPVRDIEAISRLVQSVQRANQTFFERIVRVQQAEVQFASSTFTTWLEAFNRMVASSRTLMQQMGQQTQEQQEAFQHLAREWGESSFDFLRAPLSFYPPSLQLTEQGRLCLLALESRYPAHVVDINEEVLGPQRLGAEGWRASDLIELFQSTAPHVLQEPARLIVTVQQRGIYLLERSVDVPALRVYCGMYGAKMPAYRGNMAARGERQAHRPDEAPGGNDPVGSSQMPAKR
ncbi:MAG TPA: hypothetical protein VKB35_08385 [Ktedonobacteraceae bacterium]|nr:hypothetical protein [Ktedonobacteraceae bacterium]